MATFIQPFGAQQSAKRSFSALDGPDAAGVKRACGGFQTFRPAVDVENMAPPQAQVIAGMPAFCAPHTCPPSVGFGIPQNHQQHMQIQHVGQQVGGECVQMVDCAGMPTSDGMEMDGPGLVGRFERFPAKGSNGSGFSPTHYHKSTAIGYVPPLPTVGGQEECSIRMWECDFAGKNDYY